MNPFDTTLTTIADELKKQERVGILLAAQLGGTPEEIQLMIQLANYNEEDESLRPQGVYVVRCVGVREQRLSLGLFGTMAYSSDHPLLWNHNTLYHQVYFRGKPTDVNSLMLDLNQIYGQYYGPFRTLADDLNLARPLGQLLATGYGLLGEMPEPMAKKVVELLKRHGVQAHLLAADQKPPPIQFHLLVLDDSFIVAQMYSAEPLRGKAEKTQ
ncbi:MAG: hypothetical protein CUN55_08540 [Phototrophicales bacterium]|nr:MAG: hypothetical protein CUN55_08540 [Phototrophicales bacterium]